MDWPLALIAFVVFIVALIGVQAYYLRTGQPTISARITALYRRLPIVGVFAGLVVGFLGGHWLWCDCI